MFDYLIVGAGLFGAVFAREMTEHGRRCLVIDRRAHIAGNAYTEAMDGIDVHKYGAHIFHTSAPRIWQYVQRFASWRPYHHQVRVRYGERVYSFPVNLMTLQQLWGVTTPAEAEARLGAERTGADGESLEAYALRQVGREIYQTFIEGYTTKQWGRHPSELPASILKRLPVRFTYDDAYFDDPYQGIPTEGYTKVVARMLEGIEVQLESDYLKDRSAWDRLARQVVYTGPIDALFAGERGWLEYRSLRFEEERHEVSDYQGCAVVNYASARVPWTRIIEHKHFTGVRTPHTILTREYPADYSCSREPYYPIPDERNKRLAAEYVAMAEARGYIIGGRLGTYRYYDMHQVIGQALERVEQELVQGGKA